MAKTYGGRCKTIGSVGEGGQAHVFTVEDANGVHQERFVLKRLKNIKRMDLFEREVNALRAVDHPNILRVVDFALNADPSFYVAEYCEGGSLDKRAEEFKGNIRGAAEVLTPIIAALRAAHAEGVFHRDVKPPNILFRKDGTPVLGDFGICHMEGDERVTLSDEAMGSKDYIAPEMESGRQGPVTGAVDVYALGKVMYWMVSGGRIFARKDHRAGNLYLPSILSAQRWDHVHSLLDRVLTEDPRPRLHIGDLTT